MATLGPLVHYIAALKEKKKNRHLDLIVLSALMADTCGSLLPEICFQSDAASEHVLLIHEHH